VSATKGDFAKPSGNGLTKDRSLYIERGRCGARDD
jgi:hypothetical protein